jgi:VCBS repeat-containing protein
MTSLDSHKLRFKRFVRKCLEILAVTAIVLLFSAAFAQTEMSITVSTNSDTYDPGETVTISGVVKDISGIGVPSATISIQVNDPANHTIHISMQYSGSEGSYTDSFVLADDSLTGNYGVFVTASKLGFASCRAQTSFSVPKAVINQTSSFTVDASPASQIVNQGQSATYGVTVSLASGTGQTVTLSIEGLPADTAYTFNPSSGTPTYASTLMVQTSSTTPTGTFTLTIKGSGGGISRSKTVTLQVNPAATPTVTPTPTPTSTPTSTPSPTPKPGGCLIATATYESELSPEVQFLRGFREEQVMSTHAGRQFLYTFNMFYYSFSPNVARLIESNSGLRALCKVALYPLISILMLAARSDSLLGFYPEIGVIISGFLASILIGIVYFSPIAVILKRILKACEVNLRVRLEKPTFTILLSSVVAMSVGEAFPLYATMSVATAIFVVATVCLSVFLFMRFLDSCLKFFRI